MDILRRHNVRRSGQGRSTLLFAHGFGCDQQMWRFVAPAFEANAHEVVLFDHVGCGGPTPPPTTTSAMPAWTATRRTWSTSCVRSTCARWCSSAIRWRADRPAGVDPGARPFCQAGAGGASARYLNDPPAYVGGSTCADIDGPIDMMDRNQLGWANFLAPLVMNPRNPAELTEELRASLCAGDPYITRRRAKPPSCRTTVPTCRW